MSSSQTRGCPPIEISEKSRQCISFSIILLSLLLCQVGLALLALSFYVRPYLQRHHLVTGQKVNSDLFPYGLIAASAATLISSCLAVMSGVSARQRRKTGRRAAVQFGYFYLFIEFATTAYLLAIGIVFILQLDSFQAAYQRGFSRAMWRYMQSQPLKEYLDGVQQDFGCCGALGFSDWFVVDWYPRDLYSTRYRTAAKQRSSLAKKAFLAKDKYPDSSSLIESFSMDSYGTDAHMEKVAKAMDYEFVHGEYTSALLHMKTGVPFAEVPFSCCDPSAPTWCHQMYATYPWYNYEPTRRLSIHTVGCTYKVKAFLSGTVTWLVAILFCTMALKAIIMILYRYVQTSLQTALDAGRHLSPALGYLVPLPAAGGAVDSEEKEPLLDSEGDSGTTDETLDDETADQMDEEDDDTEA
ncbi:RDS/peripherin-like protein xRDS35 [Amphibalanus amphitrite]|uniref:RDS/peripherin-like protein xRDS35 n=1 Tax=Amphibalanus amphitrite TaxID=1232801 RepID=UPI001C92432B|nr:RDS/peripherin-like protein xRDS35 [Amphibalanus amphitrite]